MSGRPSSDICRPCVASCSCTGFAGELQLPDQGVLAVHGFRIAAGVAFGAASGWPRLLARRFSGCRSPHSAQRQKRIPDANHSILVIKQQQISSSVNVPQLNRAIVVSDSERSPVREEREFRYPRLRG